MTPLSRARVNPYSISLKLCLYVVPFMRYSASKNGVTFKTGLGVTKMIFFEYYFKEYYFSI